jgi:hypothetical protein
MIPGLVTSVCHLMAESSITISNDYRLSCIMYCALVANPSTGKSTGLNLVKEAVNGIENFVGIKAENSNLVNGNN